MIIFLKEFYANLQSGNNAFLKDYGWGDFRKFWSRTANYPFLNVFSDTKNFEKGLTTINLTISVADIVREDDSNLEYVEDTTLQLLRDVYNVTFIKLKEHGLRVGDFADVRFFKANGGDVVAGHSMTLSISIFEGSDLCNNILNFEFLTCNDI